MLVTGYERDNGKGQEKLVNGGFGLRQLYEQQGISGIMGKEKGNY